MTSLTEEQIAIISAAVETNYNLAVVARAGSGKTFTLVRLAEALPSQSILCLAFNKAIAVEMSSHLPANCEAKTLHSLGLKAWGQFIRQRFNIDSKKSSDMLYKVIQSYRDDLSPEEYSLLFEHMGDMRDAISQSKQVGWLPEDFTGHWTALVDDADFFESLPIKFDEIEQDIIRTVTVESFKAALRGHLDFDDMIFCPALCSVEWPIYDILMIDEAQDLSPLNHFIIRKIARKNRVIAVGDPYQAIYGFRGASTKSMTELITMFNMERYYLTMTFRCAKSIVSNARWRADDLRALPNAAEGLVKRPLDWTADDINDGDAIICRNNAPLFSLAIRLIKAGRLPTLAGADIGAQLKKIMTKLSRKKTVPHGEAIELLKDWRDKQLARAREGAEKSIHDKFDCIKVVLDQTETLRDAITYLEHLLNRDGRIELMTGHKAKGLEFKRVFFLDSFLCKMKHEQDQNLKYVIETRAKEELVYVTSDSFEMEEYDEPLEATA